MQLHPAGPWGRLVCRIAPVLGAVALVALGSIQPTNAASASASAVPVVGGPASGQEVVVKFDPRLGVRMDASVLEAGPRASVAPVRSLLSTYAATVRPRFVVPGAQVDPTLGSYYEIDAPSAAAATALEARLQKAPGVLDAYLAPRAAPPPPSPPPSPSPDLTVRQQSYTSAAPHGIGVGAADLYGIHGSGVSVFDLEYSWNKDHEDLTDLRAPGAMIANGTPVDPFADQNHGTAVVGELDANPNTIGVTGLAYDASIHTINVSNAERGYDLGNAIALATSRGRAGDVILVEQQQVDAKGAYVPVEYYPEYYDAIRAATAKGLIVVEPAGNGGRNLDDPVYGRRFPFNRQDSGAIIVGAGVPSACDSTEGVGERGALAFSDYGARVNLQGAGACVTSTGFGYAFSNGTDANSDYTSVFGGTSSASPIVASAAALVVEWGRVIHAGGPATNHTLSPQEVRQILVATGTPQRRGDTRHIGPLPDLARAFTSLLPSAGAIPDQTVASGTQFTLRAPNVRPGSLGGALTYQWAQVGGPAVSLASPSARTTTVTGVTGPVSLAFELRVTDPRRQTSTAITTVTVTDPATLVADAGPDFGVFSGVPVSIPLSSSGSGPGPVTDRWTLVRSTDGQGGSIMSPAAATTSTSQFVPHGDQTYTYRLTVTTGGRSATDDVVVSAGPK